MDIKDLNTAAPIIPPVKPLEKSLASIENGKHGLAFASGLAAMDADEVTPTRDEVISTNDLYGGSADCLPKYLKALA